MGDKHNSSDYRILAVLGVISAICVVGIVLWTQADVDEDDLPPIRSAQNTAGAGLMACREFYQRLGLEVGLHDAALLGDDLRGTSVLLVIDPSIPLPPVEMEGLDRWVSAGGVLVCTPLSPAPRCLKEFEDHGRNLTVRAFRQAGLREGRAGSAMPSPTPVKRGGELPLDRDLLTMAFESSGTIYVPPSTDRLAPQPLLADSVGVRIATRAWGRGRVIVLADSSFLSNRLLGQADNAVAAANLAAYALSHTRGGRLAFDEYHFEQTRAETGWSVMGDILTTTSPGWGILTVTLAGLLYLVSKGRQFGTRRPGQGPRRRSRLEFVQSVGATFRAAGANRVTLMLIFQSFKARCSGLVGLDPSTPAAALAARLAALTGCTVDCTKLFAGCEAALAAKSLSQRRLNALVVELAQLESEVFHGS